MREVFSWSFIFLGFIFISCTSQKINFYTEGDILVQARVNAIEDFVKNKYNLKLYSSKGMKERVFDVFWIVNKESDEGNIYVFTIFPEYSGFISLSVEDQLGKVSNSYFPTNYLEKNGVLFVWKDTNIPLRQDVLNIMNQYYVLDSTDVKIALGILSEDYVDEKIVLMNSKLKSVHYYFCKKNLSKNKKVITNKALGYYNPPIIKCN